MIHQHERPERSFPLDLAEQRRQRGISLQAVAQATKISPQFLQAIEAEEFQKLPGGIYNTCYIRQYAAFTNINEVNILERYVAFIDAVDPAQPDCGISRLQHVLHRMLGLFRKRRPHAADRQTQQVLNT